MSKRTTAKADPVRSVDVTVELADRLAKATKERDQQYARAEALAERVRILTTGLLFIETWGQTNGSPYVVNMATAARKAATDRNAGIIAGLVDEDLPF